MSVESSTKRYQRTLSSIVLGVVAYAASLSVAAAADVPAKGQSRVVDAVKASGTMRVGLNVALPWLGQNPQTREFFGPAMEIGNEIAKALGVKMAISTAASDVIVAGLQANQYDLAIAPLFATP